LNLPIHVGEFIYSIADFAEYIKRDALDVVRLIADNVGGISGAMRVGLLADAHGLECTPHNWGNVPRHGAALPRGAGAAQLYWFEMPFPPSMRTVRSTRTSSASTPTAMFDAPTGRGLGYPIDRDALDKVTKRIDR
jgi:D-galactarolactone cycloisomerase